MGVSCVLSRRRWLGALLYAAPHWRQTQNPPRLPLQITASSPSEEYLQTTSPDPIRVRFSWGALHPKKWLFAVFGGGM